MKLLINYNLERFYENLCDSCITFVLSTLLFFRNHDNKYVHL